MNVQYVVCISNIHSLWENFQIHFSRDEKIIWKTKAFGKNIFCHFKSFLKVWRKSKHLASIYPKFSVFPVFFCRFRKDSRLHENCLYLVICMRSIFFEKSFELHIGWLTFCESLVWRTNTSENGMLSLYLCSVEITSAIVLRLSKRYPYSIAEIDTVGLNKMCLKACVDWKVNFEEIF